MLSHGWSSATLMIKIMITPCSDSQCLILSPLVGYPVAPHVSMPLVKTLETCDANIWKLMLELPRLGHELRQLFLGPWAASHFAAQARRKSRVLSGAVTELRIKYKNRDICTANNMALYYSNLV